MYNEDRILYNPSADVICKAAPKNIPSYQAVGGSP